MGGETALALTCSTFGMGLSPRGRGNPRDRRRRGGLSGSIPAWAGKPHLSERGIEYQSVYPRVGGETTRTLSKWKTRLGLSPRGRGNLNNNTTIYDRKRSIPAWAGKPASRKSIGRGSSVYPRVGGETIDVDPERTYQTGLSPRGRGNRR